MDKLALRVLTYNIHQGITVRRNQLSLKILKEALLEECPDIVFLQEVAGGAIEKKSRQWPEKVADQLEGLADEMWPHFAYQKNVIFSKHHHGNAILSKFPISGFTLKDLTVGPLKKRGLLHGVVHIPWKDGERQVHVMNAHLGLFQFERRMQTEALVHYVKQAVDTKAPLFIAGDFNDWRLQVSGVLHKKLKMDEAFLKSKKNHARTFPSRLPLLHLDRIYYRCSSLKTARVLRGKRWQVLSDHLPILADFVISL